MGKSVKLMVLVLIVMFAATGNCFAVGAEALEQQADGADGLQADASEADEFPFDDNVEEGFAYDADPADLAGDPAIAEVPPTPLDQFFEENGYSVHYVSIKSYNPRNPNPTRKIL